MTKVTLKLNQIEPVDGNPRKTFCEKSIEGLAQSILTDGLLQNLVVAKPKGKKKKHAIICGERRFRALTLLLERGDIDKDYAVSVEIKEGLSEDEILRMATVENVQRENLPPLEEAQAIAALIQDGENLDNIVSQTGLGVQTIRRRLMLLDLTQEAQDALRAGQINLAQAEAVSLGSAEDQQRALNQIANGWNDSPEAIKNTIIGRKPSLDLAIFDKEQYCGAYISDLLGEDENTFFADVEEFERLQREAVDTLIEKHEETAAFVDFIEGHFNSYDYQKAEEGQESGVAIVLRSSGEVEIHEGLVKPEIDESNVTALKPKKEKATYSVPLVCNMSMHKSLAVQAVLLENPRKAKELTVATKLYNFKNHDALSYFEYEENGHSSAFDLINEKCASLLEFFGVDADTERSSWMELGYLFSSSKERAYSAVQSLSDEQLEEVLVTLNALEFGQTSTEKLDTYQASIFNTVANDLKVDMRDFWRPDEAFLKRRNRDQLLEIIEEAGCKSKYHSAKGYKKGELVESMAKHFAHVLTLEAPNADELKATFWIPEAMQFPAIDPDKQEESAGDASTSYDDDFEDYAVAAE